MELRRISKYPNYSVSNTGEVYSHKSDKFLKKMMQSDKKYYYVALRVDGKTKNERVHRLVATEFLENKEGKEQVNHIDSNSFNNNVSNLEWATRSENLKHAFKYGTLRPPTSFKGKFGTEHNKSKPFYIVDNKGRKKMYGSALEMTRDIGADNSAITFARKKCKEKNLKEYIFSRGILKGYTYLPHMELI